MAEWAGDAGGGIDVRADQTIEGGGDQEATAWGRREKKH